MSSNPSLDQGFRADLIRRHDGVDVVALTGELDIATAPVLQRRMDDLVTIGKARIVVDCADLSFIDSSGVKALEDSWECLDALGVTLVIRNPSPMAVKLFRITKALRLLGPGDAA
jgi:anti-sigma B factor antagonist